MQILNMSVHFYKKSANLMQTYLPKGAETPIYSRNLQHYSL